MKPLLMLFILSTMSLMSFGRPTAAQEEQTEEELLFMDIPSVITASRIEQLITEAPASIVVITADDIKNSGATTIPDVLRLVAGVDVMAISTRDQQVSIRGLNEPQSNHLLVMIDGRSIYWDIYGVVFWDAQSIGLEEIERIEIVKSPGSSLYGANAYAGVVNIITATPARVSGTHVSLAGGDHQAFRSTLLHAGHSEAVNFKVSAEWDTRDEWDHEIKKAGRIARGNATIEHRLDSRNRLLFSGGRGSIQDRKMFGSEVFGTISISGEIDHLRTDFINPQVQVRAFLKNEDVELRQLRNGEVQPFVTTTADVEFQQAIGLQQGYDFVWGGNYRYLSLDQNGFFPTDHDQSLWALFLEGKADLTDRLSLSLGGRFDVHPLVKERFSPRGNILFSPSEQHSFRLSASQAYRNPTLINSYFFVEEQISTTLPAPFPAQDVLTTFVSRGNRDLKPEGIVSVELGYRGVLLKHFKATVNLFSNSYSDFIRFDKAITYYQADELFPGFPAGLIPKEVVSTYENWGKARGIGGEIDLNYFLTDRLSGFSNYSYQQITDRADLPSTLLIDETDRIRTRYPRHKVNTGLSMAWNNGLSANLMAHWVDKTRVHLTDLEENEYLADVEAYTLVTMRLGCRLFRETAEISLSVFNLFDHKHYEYPPGFNLPDESSQRIGRQMTAQLRYTF